MIRTGVVAGVCCNDWQGKEDWSVTWVAGLPPGDVMRARGHTFGLVMAPGPEPG